MPQKSTPRESTVTVSPSQIQYTIITSNIAYSNNSFYSNAFDLLRSFPKDLLQLKNSAEFYYFSSQAGLRTGINLFMLPNFMFDRSDTENFQIFKKYSDSFNKDLVKVFIIDKDIDNHKAIGKLISKVNYGYYVIVGDAGAENASFYDKERSFADAHELIKLIEKDLPNINAIISRKYGIEIKNFDFFSNPNANEINPYYETMYSKTNYYILNQILANYWLKKPEEVKMEDIPMYSKDRASIQIKQAETIDQIYVHIRVKPTVTPIEPITPSMIIIAPFHFPKYDKILPDTFKSKKEKMLFNASKAEQNLDYTYNVEDTGSLTPEQIGNAIGVVAQKLVMLDYVGYLHAQLNYSPVFRLPVVGKSLNSDLSHFQKDFPNKQSAIKKIGKIGALMREKLVADELKEFLVERDGQIVFISDLPMEWLRLGEYPICLTHDICRIPEFNFNSLLNTYVHNQRLTFEVQADILKRTLIIHCASDNETEMHRIFGMLGSLQGALGFTSVICKSVAEISEAVKTHQPDFLIFDCHGNFDAKDLSSYLVVDGKNGVVLTGEDIIANQISAPLVFISACSTQPNYGYVKLLSDAFLQAGAFSVTATFLPIQMIDAAALLVRLLNNLKQQETKIIFFNWLAFVSHTLRSVLIFETVRKIRLKHKLNDEIDDTKIAEILLELMIFSQRENAFENLTKYLQSIDPSIKPSFENLEHEWLSYTTIGRADLIYFEKWKSRHQEVNLGIL